jgi:hypothetical protein
MGKAGSAADDLAHLLAGITGGKVEASVDGVPWADLDAGSRTVRVQMDPVRGSALVGPFLKEAGASLWAMRGFPSALARSGWQVQLRVGPDELLRMGRDTSPLTGHVHVGLAALWRLRAPV